MTSASFYSVATLLSAKSTCAKKDHWLGASLLTIVMSSFRTLRFNCRACALRGMYEALRSFLDIHRFRCGSSCGRLRHVINTGSVLNNVLVFPQTTEKLARCVFGWFPELICETVEILPRASATSRQWSRRDTTCAAGSCWKRIPDLRVPVIRSGCLLTD